MEVGGQNGYINSFSKSKRETVSTNTSLFDFIPISISSSIIVSDQLSGLLSPALQLLFGLFIFCCYSLFNHLIEDFLYIIPQSQKQHEATLGSNPRIIYYIIRSLAWYKQYSYSRAYFKTYFPRIISSIAFVLNCHLQLQLVQSSFNEFEIIKREDFSVYLQKSWTNSLETVKTG